MYSEDSRLAAEQKPELNHLKFLHGIYTFLIVTIIVMPQYFGIHIGYDITCSRFADILLTVYMFSCPMVLTHFWKTTTRCSVFYPLAMYVLVGAYTMVFRVNVNAFFLIFLEAYTFFLMIYGIRYVLGYKKALKLIIGCAYFLAVCGLIEFLYGRSIFLQLLATMPTKVGNSYRSGQFRIMGPCGHSLGYGLLLIILIAIACYDIDRDEMNLFRRPFLFTLLLVNVFLNGSRSTLGIVVLECFLIMVFSRGVVFKKTIFYVFLFFGIAGTLLFLLQGTEIGRYFMGQIMSVVDQVFDTTYAAQYGIDSTTLQNSSDYRDVLPRIFTLDWLNPFLGRGSQFGGAEIDGVYIHSIDNYYVSQYIQYAYPGLVCYALFIITALVTLVREIVKFKSGLAKMTLIGISCYFVNLWWVDALQTLKFTYLLLAVFFAYQLERKDREKRAITARKEEFALK